MIGIIKKKPEYPKNPHRNGVDWVVLVAALPAVFLGP